MGLVTGLAVAAACLSSCASSGSPSTGGIVATNAVLASIVQEIVGESVTVETVVPDGKDPHEFEPSAGDIARIANARLVIANGFGYEPTLKNAIAAARADKVPVFDVEWEFPGLASGDPHWFTDPLLAASVAPRLSAVLAAVLGRDLDGSFAAAVSTFQSVADEGTKRFDAAGDSGAHAARCAFGSEHIFLAPFSERFSCPGSAVLHSGSREHDSEPSASDIEAFVVSMERNGVAMLVEDESEPSKVLEQVARESGARLVRVNVHAMGGAGTYREYILNIVDSIVAGMR